jgi:ankyrin repeat protein
LHRVIGQRRSTWPRSIQYISNRLLVCCTVQDSRYHERIDIAVPISKGCSCKGALSHVPRYVHPFITLDDARVTVWQKCAPGATRFQAVPAPWPLGLDEYFFAVMRTDSDEQQLWTAAQEGRVDDVRAALERAEPQLWWIRRAVAVAALNDHADVVRELLHPGDPWCMHLVMKGATTSCSMRVMEAALTFPASRQFFQDSLCVASDQGHVDMVRLLLSANAHVDGRERDDGAPISRISGTGHCSVQVLQTLLSAKADVQVRSPDTVYAAACAKRVDVVQVLADAKADIDACGGAWGSTPLCTAASDGALNMMQWLLRAKADVDKACERHGFTPVMTATAHAKSDALRLLVSAKADVNVPNSDGETPADVARRYNDDDILCILLDAKADVGRP